MSQRGLRIATSALAMWLAMFVYGARDATARKPASPPPFDHNRRAVGFALEGRHAGAPCASCHTPEQKAKAKSRIVTPPRPCASCHTAPKHGDFGACGKCHSTSDWITTTFSHDKTAFPLDGRHVDNINATCEACHTTMKTGDFAKADRACSVCHSDPHGDAYRGKSGVTGCASCHTTKAWSPTTIDGARHVVLFRYPLIGGHTGTPCASCHTNATTEPAKKTSRECSVCHATPHGGQFTDRRCESCHDESSWKNTPAFEHAKATGFPLTDGHARRTCGSCHATTAQRAASPAKPRTANDCAACHTAKHATQYGPACTTCHDARTWKPTSVFDHQATMFPLDRRHRALACATCHDPQKSPRVSPQCGSCHNDPHRNRSQRECDDCHRGDRWTLIRFDHDRSLFPLRGRHFATPCRDCHTNDEFTGLSFECIGCHRGDAVRANNHNKDHRLYSLECGECHKPFRW